MGRQFENVSTRYGAPMGRHCAPDLKKTRRSIRLFRVNLDSGGYDDGGAYWGFPCDLWAAVDSEGDMQTVRAASRIRAAFELEIPNGCLRVPFKRDEFQSYCYALIDGRAPMPQGKDAADVYAWAALTPDPEIDA
jgi:hypothetical protein